MRKLDLTGRVYGRLTVLEDVGRKNRGVIWRCICECGNFIDVASGNLQSGNTQSCGCYKRERTTETNKKDLTGQVFGRLTVLEDAGRTKQSKVIWRCLCECGNITNAITASLQSGNTQSCGCLQKERTSKINKKNLTGQKFGRLTVLKDVGRTKRQYVIWRCLCECGIIVDVTGDSLLSGHTQSCGCYYREQHAGENHHNWKGGITPLNHVIRNCTLYFGWRTSVFHRDFYTCQHCHKIGGKLHAHHIKFFSTLLKEFHITTLEEAEACEALWDVSNGITLCKKCHKKEHVRLRALDIPE